MKEALVCASDTQDASQPGSASVAENAPGDALDTSQAGRATEPLGPGGDFPVAKWSRYAFIALLGHGGMGSVYRARDLRLGREVALKFIRGGDPRLTMRLLREARAQARVEHDNVCKVFEVGEVEGKAYIAMQLVSGGPLGHVARDMSLHDKVAAVRDVALALHAAHTLGILHRDVKPGNILVETTEDGRHRPIVMDFGVARDDADLGMTETGDLLGTPAYMSPEQARGDWRAVDRRSDVYGLGATLYELLAGAPPFADETPVKVVLKVLSEEPVRLRTRVPAVPEDLETIVGKCLGKDPGQRYDSARALADDLDRYIRGEPILGRREGLLRRLRRRARRHRGLIAVTALALVGVAIAGGLAVRTQLAARRQAELARELGQDVKEIEWFLRAAHMTPLHDVTRERSLVKEQMRSIEERATDATAPLVDYALGRGHLALGEDDEAHVRLVRAQAAGLDAPELHYALGIVLGRLYAREVQALRGTGDPRWVEQRMNELTARYLTPALASLERSRGVRLAAPSYLEGLVAFYRKDYDRALQLAEQARAEAPWSHDSLQLAAEVCLTRGIERLERGDLDAADDDLTCAARRFDAAAEFARSDGALYEGGATAFHRMMDLDTRRGAPSDDLPRVIERAEKAAAVRPDRSEPHVTIANAYIFSAGHGYERGEDTRLDDERGLAAARRAVALDPNNPLAHEVLAWLLLRVPAEDYEPSEGGDRSPWFDTALKHIERARELAPTHPWIHNDHGLLVGTRIAAAINTGGDPTPHVRASLDSLRRAAELDGGHGWSHSNALFAYCWLAKWLVDRGRDPEPELAEVAALFAACMRGNPAAQCQENMGIIDYWRAEYAFLAGRDARELLARTQENLETAARVRRDYPENLHHLAALHLLRARDALRRDDDPLPALRQADAWLDACRRVAPGYSRCLTTDARRHLLLADLAADPDERRHHLERARAGTELAVAGDRWDGDHRAALAAALHRLAAAADAPDLSARYRHSGLAACERGLAINPNNPRLLATRGALLVLAARTTRDRDTRATAVEGALASLRRALELHPLLRDEVLPLVAEAERLRP